MSAGFDMQAGSGKHAAAGIRVSDAERDAAAAELREHYAAGRLSVDELDERISQAFAARTRGDLAAVTGDLPSLRPGGAPLPSAGRPPSAGRAGTRARAAKDRATVARGGRGTRLARPSRRWSRCAC